MLKKLAEKPVGIIGLYFSSSLIVYFVFLLLKVIALPILITIFLFLGPLLGPLFSLMAIDVLWEYYLGYTIIILPLLVLYSQIKNKVLSVLLLVLIIILWLIAGGYTFYQMMGI